MKRAFPHFPRLGLALLMPSLAFASVGKIAVLEGKATRTPGGGTPVALAVGSELEVHDTLEVTQGNLKLQLNDQSVLMLGEGSKLTLDEASFSGQERKGFLGSLSVGKLWTKVSKAMGGEKFEVKTDRAVAGVRGTIFRIDAGSLLAAAKGKNKPRRKATVVAVSEGVVDVTAKVRKAAAPETPPVKKGERKEIAPPFKEISKDEWEEKFVQLKANMKVTVGEDLWQEAAIEPDPAPDAFARFVLQNQ